MNNPQPTPSPMEDSRELDQLIQAIYKNGHFDGRWSVKGDKESTAKFDVWKEALLRDRRKSDIRAKLSELNNFREDNDGRYYLAVNGNNLSDRKKSLESQLQQLESEE